MTRFKHFCAALALTLGLAFSAFAGQMDTTRTMTASPTQQATSAGEMDTTRSGKISTPAMEIALSLLQNVLSLI